MSFLTSSNIYSNGRPQTWTQKGAWVKEIFDTVNPFLHWHRRRRLFSKFHGPLLSTHSNWHNEPNLNCQTLFPTSTILKSDPIFHAVFRVFLKALWFCCRSVRRHPKRLNKHSSRSSDLAIFVRTISSASSFVGCSFWKLFKTSCSMELHCKRYYPNQIGWVGQEKTLYRETKGETHSIKREKTLLQRERKHS